jgi:3-hydroxyacyl-CoA dehydrogenase/enoyl-CoA hydratase/3-hydroxybutyryl-CoA epimerase
MNNFKIETDDAGIALITFDVPDRSMNTLTGDVIRELGEIAQTLSTDANIKGAIITSGKASGFCAGADLGELGGSLSAGATGEAGLRALFDSCFTLNKTFRAIETCGKPVVAAINGLALGGGLEICLASHYRIVADNPKIKLGLPEAKVGLLPGAGGTQRLPRLIGVMKAAPYLLEGKTMSPQEALGMGVVHEVVPEAELITAARKYLTGKPDAVAPWDKKEFKIPGGGPYTPATAQVFIMGNAMLRKQSYGNYPAQINIMKSVYEGLQVPIDAALRIESRYFAKTAMTPQARGMIRTLFLSMDQLSKGAMRPEGIAKSSADRVAVLGAGMMGAGIAYVQALAGIESILIDTTEEGANKGRDYSVNLTNKSVKRGKLAQDKADALLARIHPTTDYSQIKGGVRRSRVESRRDQACRSGTGRHRNFRLEHVHDPHHVAC